MARRYTAPVANATIATGLTNSILCLTGTAAARAIPTEVMIGSRNTADNSAAYKLSRHITTAPAGGTAITPSLLDKNGPAALVVARTGATGSVLSTGPTLGDLVLQFGLHQRAPFRWIANPGFEPIGVMGANDGFTFTCDAIGGSAFIVDMVCTFEE